jgi:hypothetical protein
MRTISLGIIILLSALRAFCQQPSSSFLFVDVREEDWGIRDWSLIRLGQLSVLHERAGDQLHAQVLSNVEAPEMPKSPHSATPSCDGNCFLVSSFEGGSRNQLGGYYSAFSLAPSASRLTLAKWDGGHRALTMEFSRAAAGFCGMWVHLFDFRQSPADRIYLDIGNYAFLTFWIRGQRGNERILLKVSDADWERKDDALPVGELSTFLPSRKIESTWQRVIVPLSALPRNLNSRRLASLVFEAVGSDTGRIAIKDLAFCLKSEPLPALTLSSDSKRGDRKLEKAMWVWNTAEILPVAAKQTALADFCLRQGIGHLYLQLPKKEKMDPRSETLPLDDQWRRLLSFLADKGIRCYALDGYKEFALPEWHERVLDTVDKVIAYNRAAAPGEQFAGMHYDIEPYLLSGFHGPKRQQILTAYLELLEKISARSKSAGMSFGVDIPFWYDTPDAFTGKDFVVEFHGKPKPASEHIIDLVDSVGVMDYRTSVFGADGIAAQAEGELAYAARSGKTVFIGLETVELPDEELIQFKGKPVQGIPDHVSAQQIIVLERASRGARVWLIPATRWDDFFRSARERTDAAKFQWWLAAQSIAVPSSKLTFAYLGADKLQQAVNEAEEELLRWNSFTGFAFHDYIGLQSLLESSK